MSTITATANASLGRMALLITPTVTGSMYVFRRDSIGVGVVRQTTEGLAVTSGVPVTIYDYEPRQGLSTDYLLTNQDGASQATTTVTIPKWGTWLKSPGRPWLNVLTALNGVGDVERELPREVVWIEGAENATVISERRHSAGGTVTLAVRTSTELASLLELVSDGGTLMLDTAPEWTIPYRYINVGNVVERRLWDADTGLDKTQRLLVLQGVLAANMPLGPLETNTNASYDALPVKFPSYAYIAATVASYNALAVT